MARELLTTPDGYGNFPLGRGLVTNMGEGKMSILLVADDLEDQNVVNVTLHEAGFTVLPVTDGLSGLDLAISDKPELIIADFRLQGLDIVNFVKRIRRRGTLEKIPILLLVRESDYDPIFLRSIGVQAIVNKPIDPSTLSKEVIGQIGPPVRGASNVPVENNQALSNVESQKGVGVAGPIMNAFESLEIDQLLRKTILDVFEKVAWDVVPGVIEAALPKEAVRTIVERVVWETVPALAEIEIKKEIQRLQAE